MKSLLLHQCPHKEPATIPVFTAPAAQGKLLVIVKDFFVGFESFDLDLFSRQFSFL